MKAVFADTSYWIATFSRTDQWTGPAQVAAERIGRTQIITTEEVLVEFLNDFTNVHLRVRAKAIEFVQRLFSMPRLEIVRQSHQSFLDGLHLFEARPDKSYSLTDCISMNAMYERGIRAALTADRHFSQEGFAILMQSPT
jgi:uncharacterized protein